MSEVATTVISSVMTMVMMVMKKKAAVTVLRRWRQMAMQQTQKWRTRTTTIQGEAPLPPVVLPAAVAATTVHNFGGQSKS
jgi:hypothetical protein